MYKLRPLVPTPVIKELPSSMYKMKSYFQETNVCSGELTTEELQELNKQHDKQLKKLERLIQKSNDLCDDLDLSHLVINDCKFAKGNNTVLAELDRQQEAQLKRLEKLSAELSKVFESLNLNTTDSAHHSKSHEDRLHGLNLDQFLNMNRQSTKRNPNVVVEDFVIQLDSQHVPYLLFALFENLSKTHKCFIKFHFHNTFLHSKQKASLHKLSSFGELFNRLRLGLTETRSSYDFGFTFIWTSGLQDKPQLNTLKQKVQGEQEILTFVNNVLPENERIDLQALNTTSRSFIEILKKL